jgi:membrane-associated phospholipid phosphatase
VQVRSGSGTIYAVMPVWQRISVGLVCLAAYLLLGSAVASSPPHGIDAAAAALVGPGAALALLLTESYMLPVLLTIGLGLALLAWRAPAWRARALFSIVLTPIAWRLSDLGKDFFRRTRPEHWLLHHESSFSYASGHAMYAVILSGLWAFFVWKSDLPRAIRAVLIPALIAWGVGAVWSRLALGAHYPSDLLGGMLLGTGLLALGSASCVAKASQYGCGTGENILLK